MSHICVIGAGGHGIEPIKSFLNQPHIQTTIYYLTSDWGGSTGTLGRIFEYQKHSVLRQSNMLQIGLSPRPVLPLGDINKLILSYMQFPDWNAWVQTRSRTMVKFDPKTHLLDFRSDVLADLLAGYTIFSGFFQLGTDFDQDFKTYLEALFAFYEPVKHSINYHHSFCLGNLIHYFIYFRQGLTGLNNYYHQLNILPKQIQIDFTSFERQTLLATSIVGLPLSGENAIDSTPLAIDQSSLILANPSLNEELELVTPTFLDAITKADLVIIPNGSIANWLPLVNIQEVQNRLQALSLTNKLVWMTNLFHTTNELQLQNYIYYLFSKCIFPLILGPQNGGLYDELQDILYTYADEGKMPQALSAIQETETYFIQNYCLAGNINTLENKRTLSAYQDIVTKFGPRVRFTLKIQKEVGVKYQSGSVLESLNSLIRLDKESGDR